jgi:hypothetical protein
MYAHDVFDPPMFSGLARSHRIRDLAAVALCLSFIGGFVAHTTGPATAMASPSPSPSHALAAATAIPQGCPDVRVQ